MFETLLVIMRLLWDAAWHCADYTVLEKAAISVTLPLEAACTADILVLNHEADSANA